MQDAHIIIKMSKEEKKVIDDYCREKLYKVGPWMKAIAMKEIARDRAKVEYELGSKEAKVEKSK
jgi:hypothetical protein